jgi:hypothetical protein
MLNPSEDADVQEFLMILEKSLNDAYRRGDTERLLQPIQELAMSEVDSRSALIVLGKSDPFVDFTLYIENEFFRCLYNADDEDYPDFRSPSLEGQRVFAALRRRIRSGEISFAPAAPSAQEVAA